MIPRDTIEKVLSAARIEEVVGDYVSLRKRGANLIGLCPFHDEKTGSFTVSPSKGIFKCFGCGKAGDVVTFVREKDKCSYIEAIKTLGKRYHIEIEERTLTPEEQQRKDDRESMFVVNEFAHQWFREQLLQTREGQAIGLTYLRGRGISDASIETFQLGYSPDRSLLSERAVQQGYNERFLLNDSVTPPYIGTGVCLKSEDGRLYDRFHSRIIFPFFSQSGKVIGFAGRIIKKNDKVGKYVNSPTSLLFEKHNELYGLYQAKQAISRLDNCYLVEGQLDVISMHQAGIENVVSSGGTSLTPSQIKLLHRFTNHITVLYDGDKAGIKAAIRGIDMILKEGMDIRMLLLPEGEDPDSFARSNNASDFIAYIDRHKTDFVHFVASLYWDECKDPEKRSEVLNMLLAFVSQMGNQVKRQDYIRLIASVFNSSEQLLSRELARLMIVRKASMPSSVSPAPSAMTAPDSDFAPGFELGHTKDDLEKQQLERQFDHNMHNLLQLIVRYGERVLFADSPMQVGEYIINELNSDDIVSTNELHRLMLDEYMMHHREQDFVAEAFFVHHQESRLAQLAIDMVAEPYQLSRIYSRQIISENVVMQGQQQTEADILPELTDRLLLELKLTVINQRIQVMQRNLEQAQRDNNWDVIQNILQQQPQLLNIRSEICRALGNRVITL